MPKKKPQETVMPGQYALGGEAVVHIPLSELHPFPDHPYGIREDAAMQDTADSIKTNGVIVPAIVRPRAEGGYEIVAGHRRKICCERAGITEMPCMWNALRATSLPRISTRRCRSRPAIGAGSRRWNCRGWMCGTSPTMPVTICL